MRGQWSNDQGKQQTSTPPPPLPPALSLHPPLHEEQQHEIHHRQDRHVHEAAASNPQVKGGVILVVQKAKDGHKADVQHAIAEGELGAQTHHRRYPLANIRHGTREKAHDGGGQGKDKPGDEVVEQERVLRRGVGLEQETPQVRVRWLKTTEGRSEEGAKG